MYRRPNYESGAEFDAEYPARAYAVSGYRGIAFYAVGFETEPDEDTEWSGYESRTGRIVCIMVGDDYRHSIDPADLSPIDDLAYCASCGQIGCRHDGRERD